MKALLAPGARARGHIRRLLTGSIQTVRRVASGGQPRPEARVLYYHRIDDEPHRSCVTPRAFREQMHYLRSEGYRVIPLATVAAQLERAVDFSPRTVAITFDDGFADNYVHAFPVLSELGIPATIFVTVAGIGGKLTILRDRPAGIQALTWEQLREMLRGPVTAGSHTLTHPRLTELSATALDEELQGSRRIIETETGVAPELFCYPRGDLNPSVRSAVRRAGYRLACATRAGGVTARSDQFAVPRTFVARDDQIADFARKLDGAFDSLHHGVQLLRRHWPGTTLS